MRSETGIRELASRHLDLAARFAFIAAVGLITLIALRLRLSGLNPPSLWLDDEWVGLVVRKMTLADFFRLRPPVPIGFVIVEKFVALFARDPEWPLQLLPLACSVASVPLMAAVTLRVTRRASVAVLAAALAAVCPMSSQLAVRVKQYGVDGLLVTVLLLAGIPLLTALRPRRGLQFAAIAICSVVFSFPSVFVSVPLFHLAVLLHWTRKLRVGSFRLRDEALNLALIVGFDLAFAIVWLLLLRGQTSQAMTDYWAAHFMPSNLDGALSFLRVSGWEAVQSAVPDYLAPILVLVPLGILDLASRPLRRGLACVVVLMFIEIVCASALHLYPLGGGRTDSFAHPVLIMSIASGLNLILTYGLRWTRSPRHAESVAAIACACIALVFALNAGVPAGYPLSGDAIVTQAAEDLIRPDDGLVVYPHGTIGVGYYGRWPVSFVPWPAFAHNFHVEINRPNTLGLSPYAGYWDAPSKLDGELTAFLRTPYPRVIYVFAGWFHAKPHNRVLARLKARYRLERNVYNAGAQMFLFTRRSQ
jgi:hypothetical protein